MLSGTTNYSIFTGSGLAHFGGAIEFAGAVTSVSPLVTPGALGATTAKYFASTVSGATLMGYGTTGDVTLKNRDGTDVLVVTSNTLNVTLAGALAMTGALSGVTTLSASGLITSTVGNAGTVLSNSSATTGFLLGAVLTNTSGEAVFGVNGSTITATSSGGGVTVFYRCVAAARRRVTGDIVFLLQGGSNTILI